jgi:D-tagatose-1,6-bisphosphate aldolase subunit GatZ/KbaZ
MMALSPAEASIRRLRSDHLAGRRTGVVSICSARREVLEAALDLWRPGRSPLLVEATSNQVNQFGGYTGMTPAHFADYVRGVARGCAFPAGRLLLGADHLGPYVWRGEAAEAAMAKAVDLVRDFVSCGYAKIHLDTGVGCADDPPGGLPAAAAAERTARLCRAAEDAARSPSSRRPRPLYVIGAEVPPPGGSLEDADQVPVTAVDRVALTLRETELRFRAAGLKPAWRRVMAVVVQPGVEFGDEIVACYRPEKARALAAFHDALPGIMTYEVHSTDYQPADCLAQLVRDHFSVLKVGPCLTHAFRQAVFDLERIEAEWLKGRRGIRLSRLRRTLERVMLRDPAHWKSHYHGTPERERFLRRHSYRDRIRYYWGHPEVEAALRRLHANLRAGIPAELLQRFCADLGAGPGDMPSDSAGVIRGRIQAVLRPYRDACCRP